MNRAAVSVPPAAATAPPAGRGLPGSRRLSAGQWVADAIVAGLVTLGSVSDAGTVFSNSDPWWYWATIALGATGMLLRRFHPALALLCASGCALVQMLQLMTPGPVNLCILGVVYACAAYGSWPVRLVALVEALLGAFVAAFYILHVLPGVTVETDVTSQEGLKLLLLGLMVALPLGSAWLLGLVRMLVLRSREAQMERRLALAASAHERERAAIEAERVRIAQEMHDVLAHSLVTIATLSDGAELVLREDPDSAGEAIGMIGGVARDALGDVRRLLAELRHEQAPGPSASFEDLPPLLERFRQAGLRLDWHEEGEPVRLSPSGSLTAYRTVQEGLTNALRHGNGAAVTGRAAWRPEGLTITIENPVPPPAVGRRRPPGGSGYGLAGLRERVRREHGAIEFGPLLNRHGPGFRLCATIPAARAAE